MNISLNHLILSHIYSSSFLSPSLLSELSNFKFNDLKFSKSFSHFFYSDSSNFNKLLFIKSTFSHTLTQPIYISSKSYREKVFQGKTFKSKAKKLEFDFCKFIEIQTQNSSGGAIFTTVPTTITSCSFNKCSAQNGGAIFTSNELIIKHSSFSGIQAYEKDGCISYDLNYNTNINYTSFYNCVACQFSSFSKYFGKYNVIKMTNISQMIATIVTACFEIGLCTGKIIFTTVSNNTAQTKNSGISIYNSHQFIIESCLFLNLHSDFSYKQGFAIWCDGNDLILTVMKSSFYNCNGTKGKVVYVQNATTVTIYRCCFDVSRNLAVNKRTAVDSFSTFGVSRCNLKMVELYDDTILQDTTWMGYAIIFFFMCGSLIYVNNSKIKQNFKKFHTKKRNTQKTQ